MRHIGTLIAAIVIGPLAWILIAFGQARSAAAFGNAQKTGALHTGDLVRPLIFLAAAGLLLGLIATLRFSPLGAVLTGVVYVLSYVWLFIDAKGLLNLFKRDLSIGGETADPTIPVRTGTTLLVGALLLVAVASVARWRRWPGPVAAEEAAPPETAPEADELYGLGPGDATMFRAENPVPAGTGGLGGTGVLSRSGSGGSDEPTESNVPTQAAPAEPAPRWPMGSESPTGSTSAAGSAGRTPPGSPWSTPLRDETDN
jgi:hypothetical protein